MIKFIYPLTGRIGRKRYAWNRLHDLCRKYDISAIQPRVREEAFEHATIFDSVDGGPITERRRVYTFTFKVERQSAERMLADLCNSQRKLARLLSANMVLLCIDDDLAVERD